MELGQITYTMLVVHTLVMTRGLIIAQSSPIKTWTEPYKQNIVSTLKISPGYRWIRWNCLKGEKFETDLGRFLTKNTRWWIIRINSIGICMEKVDYLVWTWWSSIGDLLNERENFFHKPLVNLNHFYDVNDQVRISSIVLEWWFYWW